MKTRMHIFRVNAPPEIRDVAFGENPDEHEGPGYDQLKTLIEPLLDGDRMEHVAVLWNGGPADMFVSEIGHLALTSRPPLPRNDAATDIYRAWWLKRNPKEDPEDMHWIAGTAIVFEDRVWW